MVELAGYTARVATMCEVFEDCSEGRYARKAVLTATKQGRANIIEIENYVATL